MKAYRRIADRIIGQALYGIWTAWADNDVEWWDYAPVILEIGNFRHELCWRKVDELSISENMIPTDIGFFLDNFEEYPSHWRTNAFADLQQIIGQKILKIELLETEVEIKSENFSNRYWVPNGILFTCGRDVLCVYNTLDCNGITTKQLRGDNYRTVKIIS